MKAPIVPPGVVHTVGGPEFVGTFVVRPELTVIPSTEKIGWTLGKCYSGAEVYLSKDGSMVEEPITEKDVLVDRMEVFVPTLGGYVKALVRRQRCSVSAVTEFAIYPLEFGKDDRKCWICSTGISRKLLKAKK